MPALIFVYCLKLRVFTNDSMNMHAKRAQKSKRRMEVINVKIEKKAALIWIWCDKSVKSKWENVIDTQTTKFATACNLLVFAIFAKFI